MDHKSHVGFIYAHTKGDGGHDDINSFHKEIILCLRAGGRIESRMIWRSLDIIGHQDSCKFLNFLPREAIDDAALVWVLLDKLNDILVYLLSLGSHLIIEVRSVERTLELISICNAETFLDIRSNLIGSSGCKGYDGSIANIINDWSDAPVFGSEVMSPF